MVIKGNGAVNTMEAVKINTKEKERTKVTYHKSVFSSVLTGITWGAAILALAVLVFLVGFILIRGVKNLTLEQFAWTYNTENVTMLPAIINTVTMTVLSLLLAAPLGIFSAIYLVEYANKRGKLVGLIRTERCSLMTTMSTPFPSTPCVRAVPTCRRTTSCSPTRFPAIFPSPLMTKTRRPLRMRR